MDTKQSFLHVSINFSPLPLHSLADIPQMSSLSLFLPFPTNYFLCLSSLAVVLSYSYHSTTFRLLCFSLCCYTSFLYIMTYIISSYNTNISTYLFLYYNVFLSYSIFISCIYFSIYISDKIIFICLYNFL